MHGSRVSRSAESAREAEGGEHARARAGESRNGFHTRDADGHGGRSFISALRCSPVVDHRVCFLEVAAGTGQLPEVYGLILFSLFFCLSERFGTPPATSYEYSNNYDACYLYMCDCERQRGAYMHDCACALRRTRVSAPDMRKRARGHARQPCASS